ncbi:Gamma-glutamyl hydrolase [Dissostichus eleginoides]|uniref:Gamma-glutamyl hydrolase n=1 Tax=Dissostichus eleginoides TaxID=100907 RepID=A0AAD9C0W1_DISEL|nr:Gamma-glutamyl hydrolase [Dissostichus eleginoides]
MKTLVLGVGGVTNGVLDALHMDTMMREVESWQKDPVAFLRQRGPEHTTASAEEERKRRPLNELIYKKYFMEVPYDVCKRRRSSRVYTPPDPPGYFDGYVWPMYLKNRLQMESMVSGILFLDGLKPKEELLAAVCKDVCQEIERLRGENMFNTGFSTFVWLFFACCFCYSIARPTKLNQEASNDRPVIGILTQMISDKAMKPFGKTYIPSSYVKYIESGGSRVMPISLVFIGGAVDLEKSDYARVAKIFYRLALKANDNGDFFPIWGTCMGMQLLTVLVAGKSLLEKTTAENVALPLNLTSGKKYPFYGVQWHPEVNRFQWERKINFPHSAHAVQLSSLLAQFFVNEGRRSLHQFDNPEEEASSLIYNDTPVYAGNFTEYEQIYFSEIL